LIEFDNRVILLNTLDLRQFFFHDILILLE
jgi:hypothetical protein